MAIPFHSDIQLFDSNEIKLGTSSDLRLYHDGSNSYVNDSGTGVLVISSSQTNMQVGGANKLIVGTNDITILDNIALDIGTGGDLQILHDGSDSYIVNGTGALVIQNTADNQDIIFQSDDGSGGTETYFFLDGSASSGNPYTTFPDNSLLSFGTGRDFIINHNGTNTNLGNYTGDLEIVNYANDKDIILKSDDQSGGVETYFFLDGSNGRNRFSKTIAIPDSVQILMGNGDDLQLQHDGSNSYINNNTGDLYIKNLADDKDIIFQSDDGSGGVTAYLTLDGSIGATIVPDSMSLGFGSSGDMYINHDGTNTKIENHTGDLYINNKADDKDIIFQCDDGSGGITAYLTLDGSAGYTTVQKAMIFDDGQLLQAGAGGDLKLYHESNNSFVDNYTGDLYIRNNEADKDIIFQNDDGSGGLETYFFLDGSLSSGNPVTVFPDDARLQLGTDADLWIYSDGSNSYLYNNNGDLKIQQAKADKDLILLCDDGSGGETAYITLDGSEEAVVFGKAPHIPEYILHDGDGNTYFGFAAADTFRVGVGGTQRLNIATGIELTGNTTLTGNLTVGVDDTGHDVKFFGATSGRYLLWDESDDALKLTDNTKIKLGDGNDLEIFSDGNDGFINNNTNHFYITNNANDCDLVLRSDDGSGGVTAYLTLDGSAGYTTVQKDIRLEDNVQLELGDGRDLVIYSDGSNGLISNQVGNLAITNAADDGDITFNCDDGSGGTTEYFRLDGGLGYTVVSKLIKLLR